MLIQSALKETFSMMKSSSGIAYAHSSMRAPWIVTADRVPARAGFSARRLMLNAGWTNVPAGREARGVAEQQLQQRAVDVRAVDAARRR